MRSRAWAWLIAIVALVLGVLPLASMTGAFGRPMSIATTNICWIAALVMAVVSLGMSIRQGIRARG